MRLSDKNEISSDIECGVGVSDKYWGVYNIYRIGHGKGYELAHFLRYQYFKGHMYILYP